MNQQNSIDLTSEPNFTEETPPPRYRENSRESRLLSQINSQSREITRLKRQLDKYERKAARYKRKYIKNKYYLYLERDSSRQDDISE
jgi:hypothetical protein